MLGLHGRSPRPWALGLLRALKERAVRTGGIAALPRGLAGGLLLGCALSGRWPPDGYPQCAWGGRAPTASAKICAAARRAVRTATIPRRAELRPECAARSRAHRRPQARKKPHATCRMGLKGRLAARYFPALLSAVSSPRGLLTAVFGMGTGVSAQQGPPTKGFRPENTRGPFVFAGANARACLPSSLPPPRPLKRTCAAGTSGQASRPIRTPRVSVSPRLRLGPVNPVVFRGPSGLASGMVRLRGGLALRCFQRLSRRGVATRPCQLA